MVNNNYLKLNYLCKLKIPIDGYFVTLEFLPHNIHQFAIVLIEVEDLIPQDECSELNLYLLFSLFPLPSS
ncbi:hypothetical protein OD90_0671 [Dokdonia sp. Hel_I_53]|nr:hypothetical protein OD90_0671 [Dokdonia sp. Hel_I_53]